MLSIIIPARTEKFLNRTIKDILEKATGEIEIFPVLDGYDGVKYKPIIDKRVKYIKLPNPHNHERHKRQGINVGVSISRGKYVMWMDAHCVVARGFDEVLAKDCDDDWVVVPRRYKMSYRNWNRNVEEDRPQIDYEYFMWHYLKQK